MEPAASGTKRWESIDTAWVFRIYAAVAGVAGLLLIGWGGLWFGAHQEALRWGQAALLRVFGAQIVVAACCAWGFAAVENPGERKRALLWFSIGHALLAVVVMVQSAVSEKSGVTAAGFVLFWVAFAMFYLWDTADGVERTWTPFVSLFESLGGRPTTEQLRWRYERQLGEAARQEERNRLARDLHDSVKQQIFAIQTAAATAEVRMESDAAGARAALAQVRDAAREAAGEMQAMLDQLRAAPLENAGLIAAVRQQCEALGFRTGARVECAIGAMPAAAQLTPGSHEALLRAAQEALANVARHARAKSVRVSLQAADGRVELRIEDDGAGFDEAASAGGGQGLGNMRSRAEELNGTFEIARRAEGGTAAMFTIPYAEAQPASEYARRACWFGAGLAAVAAAWATLWWSPGLTVLSVMTLAGLARNVLAWRRVKRLGKDWLR
ncbi:MAG: sensor histidine kinase [Bryobacterales bacterium]|nr:sensor histidine kinase [Bryobacterales bacterium]